MFTFWFKKRSFTLVWKPNPPLCSVCGVHLRARADAASINQALHLKRSCWKRLSSRDQWNFDSCYNVQRLAECAVWSRRFGAAQTMHSHKCDHVKFLLGKCDHFGHSLETCIYYLNRMITQSSLCIPPHFYCRNVVCIWRYQCIFQSMFLHLFGPTLY